MRRLFVLGLVIAALFVLGMSASADAPVVTSENIEAPEHLTVGDHFRYVIKIEADAGTEVALAPGTIPDELALTELPAIKTRSRGDGAAEITVTLELAAFLPGDLVLPPLRLEYVDASGAEGAIETQSLRLRVESVLPASGEVTPRDLKPQAEIGTPAPVWAALAFVAAAVALLAVLGLLMWRRRALRRRAAIAPPAPPIVAEAGPEDSARVVLDRAGVTFGGDQDYETYYAAIAGTVREYLTQRYGFPAFALTTRELQAQMVARGMDRWLARVAVGLLDQCDAVVYAHYRPAPERADADLTAAYEIVEMSRPEKEPEEAGVP
jgi:hypothetical protein